MPKNVLTRIVDQFLFGNFFISFGAFIWTLSAFVVTGYSNIDTVLIISFFNFFATFFIYNLSRTYSFGKKQYFSGYSLRKNWVSKNQKILKIYSILSLPVLVFLALFIPPEVFPAYILAGVITGLYYFPLFRKGQKGLREAGGFKIFLISIVWSIMSLAPALILENFSFPDPMVWLLIPERFLFIFAITIPFDIRDMESDRNADLRTIPQRIGIEKSRYLIMGTLIFLAILYFVYPGTQDIHPYALTLFYAFWLTTWKEKNKNDYYYVFFWDGAIVLQALLVIIYAWI